MKRDYIQIETIDAFDKSAKRYENKFMNLDLYNDTFDKFCSLIRKKNPEILEIATGPGNITKYLYSQRPDFKISGIDLSPNMIELAKINNPGADFMVMDCKDISTINKKFDAIMCGFCMPFLSKKQCAILLEDSAALLHKGGILYLSTIEGDYNKSGFETTSFSGQDRIFFYYHQTDYLTNCLKHSGFEVMELERRKYPESDGTFLTDLIMIAKKV